MEVWLMKKDGRVLLLIVCARARSQVWKVNPWKSQWNQRCLSHPSCSFLVFWAWCWANWTSGILQYWVDINSVTWSGWWGGDIFFVYWHEVRDMKCLTWSGLWSGWVWPKSEIPFDPNCLELRGWRAGQRELLCHMVWPDFAFLCGEIHWTIALKNRPKIYGSYTSNKNRFLLHGHFEAFGRRQHRLCFVPTKNGSTW